MTDNAHRAASQRKPHLDRSAVASLLVLCFLWGPNQAAAKVALAELSPLQQVAIRCVGATLLVWLWARWRGGIALRERDASLALGALLLNEPITLCLVLAPLTVAAGIVVVNRPGTRA